MKKPSRSQSADAAHGPAHDDDMRREHVAQSDDLGEASDTYGRAERDDRLSSMSAGQDLGMTSPDVVSESPGGMGEDRPPNVDHGFADDRDRRDRA